MTSRWIAQRWRNLTMLLLGALLTLSASFFLLAHCLGDLEAAFGVSACLSLISLWKWRSSLLWQRLRLSLLSLAIGLWAASEIYNLAHFQAFHGEFQGQSWRERISYDRSRMIPFREPTSQKARLPGTYWSGVSGIAVGPKGYRVPFNPEDGSPAPGPYEIGVIGDSIVFGTGVPFRDTLASHLSRLTGKSVGNFGIPGNGPGGYANTAEYLRESGRLPHIVFVILYAGNDLNRTYRHGDGNLLWQCGNLIDWLQFWRLDMPTFRLCRQWFMPRSGQAVVQADIERAVFPKWLPMGKSHFQQADLIYDDIYRSEASFERALPRLAAGARIALRHIVKIAAQANASLTFVIVPHSSFVLSRFDATNTLENAFKTDPRIEILKGLCRETGGRCIDATEFLVSRMRTDRQNTFFPDNHHLSSYGNKILALFLQEHLLSND